MLDCKTNRLDYGTLLSPPEGYTLHKAVCTTYSLDLSTLLAIPVALFYAQRKLEGDFSALRFDVLNAIEQTKDIVRVYCQKGKIQIPQKFNSLFGYLEEAVVEISVNAYNQSFHPKVWIIRYTREKETPIYRFIVLSRNLTFDRSWDIAFCMDGEVTKTLQKRNLPLIKFANHLFTYKNFDDDLFLRQLERVEFKVLPPFSDAIFWPLGIQKIVSPVLENKFDKLLIISPFVDTTTLKLFLSLCPRSKIYIFSRKEELQKIDPNLLNSHYEAYVLNDLIIEGEKYQNQEDGGLEAQYQQLHAKLYAGISGKTCKWFLGSANCSQPATDGRNKEFLIELLVDNKQGHPDKLKNTLIGLDNNRSLFVEFQPQIGAIEEKDQSEEQIRKISFGLTQCHIEGIVLESDSGMNYDLYLSIDCASLKIPAEFEVYVKPLRNKQDPQIISPGRKNDLSPFRDIKETRLSRFVEIYIHYRKICLKSFLLKAIIDIPDTRDAKIFNEIIDSPEKFLKLLEFILFDQQVSDDVMIYDPDKPPISGESVVAAFEDLAIYEKLMSTTSRNPGRLKQIDRLIDRLHSNSETAKVIPPEFDDLWQVFKTFIPEKKQS